MDKIDGMMIGVLIACLMIALLMIIKICNLMMVLFEKVKDLEIEVYCGDEDDQEDEVEEAPEELLDDDEVTT